MEGKQITTESTSADAAAAKYKCGGGYFVTATHLHNLPSIAYNPCSPDNYKQTSPATVFLLEGWFSFSRISPFLLLQKVPTSFTNEVILDAISFPAEEEDHTLSLRAAFFLQKTIMTFFIWSINAPCPVYNLSAWRVTPNLTCPDENPLTKLFAP